MYVITEPSGLYFKNIDSAGWQLTNNINDADKFYFQNEADSIIKKLNSMVVTTFWDFGDIVPYPVLKEV